MRFEYSTGIEGEHEQVRANHGPSLACGGGRSMRLAVKLSNGVPRLFLRMRPVTSSLTVRYNSGSKLTVDQALNSFRQ